MSGMAATPVPRLLVSVRNATEAIAAIRGGASILDVKEPNNGSLGKAAASAIREVLGVGREQMIPVSAALGELTEWNSAPDAMFDQARHPLRLEWAKLGLSGLSNDSVITKTQNLAVQWSRAIRQIEASFIQAEEGWIAVAYADSSAAHAPTLREVLDTVDELRSSYRVKIAGLLIDTFLKVGPRLCECLTIDDLKQVRQQTQARGLMLGLAGRLQIADLPKICAAQPDVIAIRSAGVPGGNRLGSIDAGQVAQFADAIQAACSALISDQSLRTGVMADA